MSSSIYIDPIASLYFKILPLPDLPQYFILSVIYNTKYLRVSVLQEAVVHLDTPDLEIY